MHTITIKVNDKVFDKVVYFLNNLPKRDIEIISNKSEYKREGEDFISFLANNPVKVEKDTTFLTREEAHER